MANTAINHDPAATFPGSSTDTAVVKWSGTGGKTLANSGVTIDASNNVTVPGNITTTGYIHLTGDTKELRFYENGNFIAIKAPSLGADYTLTLPINDGSADEFLQTNGSGVLVWAAAAGTTINSNADNRVITGSGSANTLNGESNLTFDGTHLSVAAQSKIFFDGGSNTYIQELTANNMAFYADGGKQLTIGAGLIMNSDISAQNISFQGSTGFTGDTKVTSGNFVIGTNGKGIDFAIQTATSVSGATTTAEILGHYEEGTWTPQLLDDTLGGSGTDESQTYSQRVGYYTRIGNWVHFIGWITVTSYGNLTTGAAANIGGLPFASSSQTSAQSGTVVFGDGGGFALGTAGYSITGCVPVGGHDHFYMKLWDSSSGVTTLSIAEFDTPDCIFSGNYRL